MTFDTVILLLASGIYMALFFGVAYITEKGWLPERLLQHSGFYVLSLALIISTWGFYNIYTSASLRGFGYNAYYLGFAASFILSPLLLQPLLRITRRFRLSSLADLFAFRFRSAWAGTLTTLILLLCAFPLMALQNFSLALGSSLMAPDLDPRMVALAFNVVLLMFSLRFGIVDVTGRDPNNSLVASLAFEGLFKLFVLLATCGLVVYGIFGGPGDLQTWLDSQPESIRRLDMSFIADSTNLLTLLFFTAAIALPYLFHMIFPENRNPKNLRTASWGVPLTLLIASLPVMPVLWARDYFGDTSNVQLAGLVVAKLSHLRGFPMLYFIGSVAAATGLTVVLALSVASMCMNHLLLPVIKPPSGGRLYDWLMLQRRTLIVGVYIGGYLYYLPMSDGRLVLDTGIISFIACVQFLPGILTLLYWPKANLKGFLSGLVGGVVVWAVLGLLPYLQLLTSDVHLPMSSGLNWNFVISASLLTNLTLLLLVSSFTRANAEEQKAALLCAPDALPAERHLLRARSVADFIQGLSGAMGADAAGREVTQALKDLRLQSDEKRPYRLLQLRTQLEANLSSLLGPTLAHTMVEHNLPLAPSGSASSASLLNLLEQEAESWQGNLTGVALDLDLLRRHHRQILQNLPMAVCELDDRGRIALWNAAMSKLTGLSADHLVNQPVSGLPEPWHSLLQDFANDQQAMHRSRQTVSHRGKTHWLSLHKSILAAGTGPQRSPKTSVRSGQIILVEDQTETTLMEQELAHADRLNSIGRLAAGVAHEIGNPVTGIACLAQNMQEESTDAPTLELAGKILAQTRRISTITDALLRFSHQGAVKEKPAVLTPVELSKVTAEAFSLFNLQHDGISVELINACQEQLSIWADYQQLLQILLNLLANARDASQDGDRITVFTSVDADAGMLSLIIQDEGSGIPSQLQPKIFEPFFTTKDPGKGTGLGLALVYRLVTDLGGTVRLESRTAAETTNGKPVGTRVIVTFPCYDPGTLVTQT